LIPTYNIELASGNDREQRTRSQLERLVAQHDLRPWSFTDRVIIQSGVIPHSHPILTLNTRHLGQDDLHLATFLHEQIHWFAVDHFEAVQAAVAELQILYPSVPVGYPEGGENLQSSYLHLMINWLEHDALRRLLGAERARKVIEHWCSDHYTWVYRQVLDNGEAIAEVLHRHGLII